MKGSYTVEAAFVFPMILGVLTLIWYLGFYQHNRIVCQAICQEAVYAGMKARWEGRDEEAAIQRVLTEQTEYLFVSKNVQTEYKAGREQMEASVMVRMMYPFIFFEGMSDGDGWVICESASLDVSHPVTSIRRIRKLRGLIGKQKNGSHKQEGTEIRH